MYFKQIKKHQKKEIKPQVQEMLNTPLKSEKRIFEQKDFLKDLISKIENKTIDPYTPKTLLNLEKYEKLSEIEAGRVDIVNRNLCLIVSQIHDLWEQDHKESTIIVDLIESLKITKNNIENELGKVFLI